MTTLVNPLTRQVINSYFSECERDDEGRCLPKSLTSKGIKVEDVKSEDFAGGKKHIGRVAPGQIGYRAMSALEMNDLLDAIKKGERKWASRGKFTTEGEKIPVKPPEFSPLYPTLTPTSKYRPSTMFGASPEDLVGENARRHKYDVLAEVDLTDLPFASIGDLDEEGVLKADMGRGLGVGGLIPTDRIRSLKSLHWKTGEPDDDVSDLLTEYDPEYVI